MAGVAVLALAVATPATATVATPTIPRQELRQIRALLREFVPAAVGRVHPGTAWSLATPSMRSTTTHAEWRQGSLPVFPYPVADRPYGIRPITVTPTAVTFDLMLQPKKGSTAGVEVYTTEVRRVGGRWLVASMAAAAQFAGSGGPASITAQPDFAPHEQGLPARNNIDQKWVLVPLLVIGLPLIAAPIGILIVRRRGRPVGVDVEARKRATQPWR